MHHPEMRLSLRHLRLIDAIAREGSLAAAAASLNMTQSAVTKALQDAEGALGVTLFERTSRGAVPTVYGAVLVGHA
ncbi:MAG: LysR family transcriptional regulator, partial [Paracoccus sp. (in: a-proteobacteria)]